MSSQTGSKFSVDESMIYPQLNWVPFIADSFFDNFLILFNETHLEEKFRPSKGLSLPTSSEVIYLIEKFYPSHNFDFQNLKLHKALEDSVLYGHVTNGNMEQDPPFRIFTYELACLRYCVRSQLKSSSWIIR